MNDNTYSALTQHYLNLVAADPRKSVLLLKTLAVLVDGGPILDELKRVLDKVDEIAMVQVGSFRMNMENSSSSDPLARAIAHISD